jgi:hypothetical protein
MTVCSAILALDARAIDPLLSKAARPKSVRPVSLAGDQPPAAGLSPAKGLDQPKPVSNHHDHRKTYASASCGVRGFVFPSTRYRTAGGGLSRQ